MIDEPKTSLTPPRSRFRIPALLVVGALALGACGGSGSSVSSDADGTTTTATKTTGGDPDTPDDDADDPSGQASGEPVLMVPLDASAPDGYEMLTAQCEFTEEELAAEEESDGPSTYHSDITYAVPEDWQTTGRGSAGSGGTTGNDVDLTFRLPSNDKVNVEYDWDSRGPDGELTDYNGDKWQSFDYDSTIGDDKVRVEYDEVTTVSLEDQEIDLYYRDPSQAPDHINGEQYKARVEMFTLPRNADFGPGSDSFSLVLTIEFDSDVEDVTQEVVETIVGTVGMPSCVWDELLVSEETMRDMDLNGDGKVKTREELQAELQADLEELQADLEDEAKND